MKNTRPSWTYSQIQLPELSLETPASADAHTGEKQMPLVSAAVIIMQQYLTDTISQKILGERDKWAFEEDLLNTP